MAYDRVIRKITTAFGDVFNGITLVRYNPDQTEQERFLVPLAYSSKEKYVMRLQDDPNLDKKVQMTLPRMSFEMNGLRYDASRKLNTNTKNFAQTNTGLISQYNPVPYDFDFSVYLYVRTVEDGQQLIEYILPFFTPDYTIKVNLIPEMGIIKEIPITIKDTNYEVDYESDREGTTRMIIWTLNFTVKGFVFGQSSSTGYIRSSITNFLQDLTYNDNVLFNMSNTGVGIYNVGETVYQGYSSQFATATGTVVNYNSLNNTLQVSNISGNFLSNQKIIGLKSNASYTFNSFQVIQTQYAQMISTPVPTDANSSTITTATTQTFELGDVPSSVSAPATNFAGDMLSEFGVDNLNTEQENPVDLLN